MSHARRSGGLVTAALTRAVGGGRGRVVAVQALRAATPIPSGRFRGCRGLVTADAPKAIKRFYQETSVKQVGDIWHVLLDGKPLKTPKGSFLELPTEIVAQAVADEWAAQEDKLKVKEMPLTTVGCTAVDLIRPERQECVDKLIPFLRMDTLCFEDEGDLLAELQAKEWAPIRQWFEGHFSVKLGLASGFMPPAHPEETVEVVAAQLLARDEWDLAALEIATAAAKSLLVATALLDNTDVCVVRARRLALLEEYFQIERWGLVEGEHDVSHEDLLRWFAAAKLFGRHSRHDASAAEVVCRLRAEEAERQAIEEAAREEVEKERLAAE